MNTVRVFLTASVAMMLPFGALAEAEAECASRTKWFTDARFGMFIHFGAYSLAARHEWVKQVERLTDADYQKYVDNFDPDLLDAGEWVRAAKRAGMKYIVLTAKHHEGFCLWDSKETDYKSTKTPFGRDIVREFTDACRREGMRTGLYYSLLDWHHPDYTCDYFYPGCVNLSRTECDELNRGKVFSNYVDYMKRQLRELLTDYGRIDLLWYDFTLKKTSTGYDRSKTSADWDSAGLMRLTRELQPRILVNDRLGEDFPGDFCISEQIREAKCPERDGKKLVWETCQTFSGSWGYHRDEATWKSPRMLVVMLIDTVSKDGNLILNVGPTGRGQIDSRAIERLQAIGAWMDLNARSIYGCGSAPEPFKAPEGTILTYNASRNRLYIHILEYPQTLLPISFADRVAYAQFLHDGSELKLEIPRTIGGTLRKDVSASLCLPIVKPDVEVPVIEVMLKQ